MLKRISDLFGVLFGIALDLLGGMFKLLDRITGTPCQEQSFSRFPKPVKQSPTKLLVNELRAAANGHQVWLGPMRLDF